MNDALVTGKQPAVRNQYSSRARRRLTLAVSRLSMTSFQINTQRFAHLPNS